MRLVSQSNQFVFLLPTDFVPAEIETKYGTYLDKIHSQYGSVRDYLNSTIKSVSFPGVDYATVEQTLLHGKKANYKGSVPVWDNFDRNITIQFKDVDAHMNYFMVLDTMTYWYKNTDKINIHVPPFIVAILDWYRDAVFYLKFENLQVKTLNDITFDYAEQSIANKNFSLTLSFNYFDMEYILLQDNLFGKRDRVYNPQK